MSATGPAAEALEQRTYAVAAAAIQSLTADEARETYVVSFFVYDASDDPLHPTVTFGSNTETQVAVETSGASNADEARWNYAFWLQNVLGAVPSDPGDQELVDAFVDEQCMAADFGDDEGFVTSAFVALLVRVARALHSRGVIKAVFGRPVLIAIHELEYYDEIATQTRAANPRGLASSFARWVMGG